MFKRKKKKINEYFILFYYTIDEGYEEKRIYYSLDRAMKRYQHYVDTHKAYTSVRLYSIEVKKGKKIKTLIEDSEEIRRGTYYVRE